MGDPQSSDASVAPLPSIRALREVLIAHLDHPEPVDGELHRALRAVTDEARQRDIAAEQLLVQLHHLWDGLPAGPSVGGAARGERARFLDRVITLLIRQYYRPE